jgi:hypothetical protein
MKRYLILVASFASALALTAACGSERQSNTLAPTSSATAPATVSTAGSMQSLVGTWVSVQKMTSQAIGSLPSLSTCGNFQWNLTNQTATQATGTFSAVCPGGLIVTGTIVGQIGGATVPIVFTGTASQAGSTCAFTMNGIGTPIGADTFRLDYTGTSCLGPIQGTETLRLASSSPAPTPAPTPTPTPTPAPTAPAAPTGGDPVDLHTVTIVGGSAHDVADWPITTTIRALDFNSSGVAIDFSKKDGSGRWPDVVPPGWDGPLEYTIWMIVSHGGRLYTSGGVEFWHGLARSGGPPSMYAANWYYSPQVWGALASHQPAVGEQVGFFVTAGDQRAKDVRSVAERSNIVVVRFPSDAGGYYPF